jgi:hypothetical protein
VSGVFLCNVDSGFFGFQIVEQAVKRLFIAVVVLVLAVSLTRPPMGFQSGNANGKTFLGFSCLKRLLVSAELSGDSFAYRFLPVQRVVSDLERKTAILHGFA